jgi:hypothetical protein
MTAQQATRKDPADMNQPHETEASRARGRRPDYAIVVAQLPGRTWSTGPSLAEALEAPRATSPREPEAGPEPADQQV